MRTRCFSLNENQRFGLLSTQTRNMRYVSISDSRAEFNSVQVLPEYVSETRAAAAPPLLMALPRARPEAGVHPSACPAMRRVSHSETRVKVTFKWQPGLGQWTRKVQALITLRLAWLSFTRVPFGSVALRRETGGNWPSVYAAPTKLS